MKVVLQIHKGWIIIDPRIDKNEEKDYLAMGLIYQAIPESLIMQIADVESSKVLWDVIKARHVGAERVKETRLQTLIIEFDRLKMSKSESIDTYVGKLSEIASKSTVLGEVIDESKLVKKFLKTLPRSKFVHIVASLEQVLDLKTIRFEDVVGLLKAYEERIMEDEIVGEDQPQVLFIDHGGSTNQKYQKGYRRGRVLMGLIIRMGLMGLVDQIMLIGLLMVERPNNIGLITIKIQLSP